MEGVPARGTKLMQIRRALAPNGIREHANQLNQVTQ